MKGERSAHAVGSLGLAGLSSRKSGPLLQRRPRQAAGLAGNCPGFARPSRAFCSSCTVSRASSGHARPQARAPRRTRNPGRAGLDSVELCHRPECLRAIADARPGQGRRQRDPLRFASLPDSRSCLMRRPEDPADRDSDGAQPARPRPLAVHRLGGRPRRRPPPIRGCPADSRRSLATWFFPGPSAASASAKWLAQALMEGFSGRRLIRFARSLREKPPRPPARRSPARCGTISSPIVGSPPKAVCS